MIDELLRAKYSNITFYCHNLGGYDVVFLISVLEQYNDKYKLEHVFRNSKILKLKISKGKNSVTILDSLAMLTNNLATLGKNYEVNTLKSKFPYSFGQKIPCFIKVIHQISVIMKILIKMNIIF